MYDIVGKRVWFFAISILLMVIGIIFLVTSFTTPFGVKLGTEFNPGTQLRVAFAQDIDINDLKQEVNTQGYTNATIRQETPVAGGRIDYVIRINTGDDILSLDEQTALVDSLEARFGTMDVLGFQQVGPETSSRTVLYTLIAMAVAAVAMLLYVVFAFRKMPHPLRYGTCAVIALVHDVLVAAGLFALIGAFFGWEIDLLFVTGILAILGYSVNNIIVVYDRIRENVKIGVTADFGVLVNDSVAVSMGRCLNTGFTTLIALVALMLFVGATIENFVIVLLIGLIAGTFNAVCIAPSLLVAWQKNDLGRLGGKRTAT